MPFVLEDINSVASFMAIFGSDTRACTVDDREPLQRTPALPALDVPGIYFLDPHPDSTHPNRHFARKQLQPGEFVTLTKALFGESGELPQGSRTWRGLRNPGGRGEGGGT